MQRYLTLSELYTRRGQPEILRLAGTVDGAPNLARIEAAIATAESEATSYLSSRYPSDVLPAAPEAAPDVLKDKVAVLAQRSLAGSLQVSPALEAEAQAARSWLSQASRGVVNLGLAAQPLADRSGGQVLVSQANPGSHLSFVRLEDW